MSLTLMMFAYAPTPHSAYARQRNFIPQSENNQMMEYDATLSAKEASLMGSLR